MRPAILALLGFALLGFAPVDRPLAYLRAVPLPKSLEGVHIRSRFEKGKPIFVVISAETKTIQTRQGTGSTQTTQRKQTFTLRWLPRERDKAGSWSVGLQILEVEMEATIDFGGGKEVKYGPGENQRNSLANLLQGLKGAELSVHVRPDMTIAKIEAEDALVQKLAGADAQVAALLKKVQAEDLLRPLAEPLLAPMAPRGLAAGDTWQRPTLAKLALIGLGPLDGSYQGNTEYTYAGPAEGLERLTSITSMTYKSAAGAGATLPSDMTSKLSRGAYLFDRERGRLISAEFTLHMHGTLKTEVKGQHFATELDQHQSVKMRTYERNPLKK